MSHFRIAPPPLEIAPLPQVMLQDFLWDVLISLDF